MSIPRTNADLVADLREELDQQRTRAEAAEAELREMRADRDAALLHLPAGCGSMADAAATLKEDRDNLEAANRQLRERLYVAERAVANASRLIGLCWAWFDDHSDSMTSFELHKLLEEATK